MNCPEEVALLLAVHDELSLIERVRLDWHCLRCTSCRNRRRAFHRVSRILAQTLVGSGGFARPIGVPVQWRRAVLLGVTGGALVALLVHTRPLIPPDTRAPRAPSAHRQSSCGTCHTADELKRLTRGRGHRQTPLALRGVHRKKVN